LEVACADNNKKKVLPQFLFFAGPKMQQWLSIIAVRAH
jgi:hypothetical protein